MILITLSFGIYFLFSQDLNKNLTQRKKKKEDFNKNLKGNKNNNKKN
jgi:hypothetical protein